MNSSVFFFAPGGRDADDDDDDDVTSASADDYICGIFPKCPYFTNMAGGITSALKDALVHPGTLFSGRIFKIRTIHGFRLCFL